jgi:hypothetical protein
LNSKYTPHLFEVEPASSNQTTTELKDLKAIAVAIVDVEETHNLYAKDVFGNPQDDVNDEFKVWLQHSTEDYRVDAAITKIPDEIAQHARHEIKYTLSRAGTYTLRALIQPGGQGPDFELIDSPQTVVAQVTFAHAPNTVLSGEGITDAIAGILQTFEVTLFDSGNNRLTTGGDTLTVTIESLTRNEKYIEIFDNEDGSYLIKYLIEVAGGYTLTV